MPMDRSTAHLVALDRPEILFRLRIEQLPGQASEHQGRDRASVACPESKLKEAPTEAALLLLLRVKGQFLRL